MIPIDPRDLAPEVVSEGHGDPGCGGLLREGRVIGVEFVAQVVVDQARKVGCDRNFGEEMEVGCGVLSLGQDHLLAVTERAGHAGRPADHLDQLPREQVQVLRDHVGFAHADRRQEQGARGVRVAEVDVLVLLFHDLVAGRRHGLHDVSAGQDAHPAFKVVAGEGVAAVEDGRTHLVPVAQAVVARVSQGDVLWKLAHVPGAAGRQVVVPAVRGGDGDGVAEVE